MRINIIAIIVEKLENVGIFIPLKLAYLVVLMMFMFVVVLCDFGILPNGLDDMFADLIGNYTEAPTNLTEISNLTT